MMRRTISWVALAVVALLSLATTASAQSGYNSGVLGSDTTKPAPGQTITISGSNCPPGGAVDFAVDGSPAGGTTADGSGNFSGTVKAPSSPGSHTVTAACGAQVLSLEIEVQQPAAAAIPRTGSSSTLPLTSIALALLAVGGLFVLVSRRRRVAQPA